MTKDAMPGPDRAQLESPIFLVGCARSGTTLLSSCLFYHPDTGPRPASFGSLSLSEFSKSLFQYEKHLGFSGSLERKSLWYWYFGQKRIFADMGRELIVEEPPPSRLRRRILMAFLRRGLGDSRLFLKAPTNSFRVQALRRLFPDARFVAIHRDGRDVVTSWGERPYGFEKMGYASGIETFARKWNETLDYLFATDMKGAMLHVRYEDLLAHSEEVGAGVLRHCGLDPDRVPLGEWGIRPRASRWRTVIPGEFHESLIAETEANDARVRDLSLRVG